MGCNRCHAISDGDREAFGERCGSALAQVSQGRPEPFEALWWHGDDVSTLGALGRTRTCDLLIRSLKSYVPTGPSVCRNMAEIKG